MKTLRFKTNITCSGCVSAIAPYFKRTNEFESWRVDLNDRDKVLTVTGENIESNKVKSLVEEAGFLINEEITET